MSALWVFVEALTTPGSIELTPDEVRHVAARRLRVGAPLVVFDGAGGTAEARLESMEKRSARVAVEEISRSPEPEKGGLLASAIPKGERLGTMLQMLTQLGLVTWQPLVLEDSAVRRLDPEAPRLRRILVESCKVARRPFLLDVRAPCSLEKVLSKRRPAGAVFFGDREGASAGLPGSAELVLVGPEAGFSAAERRALKNVGALPRAFGAHNLRIETAAAAAAVALHLARFDAEGTEEREGEPCRGQAPRLDGGSR